MHKRNLVVLFMDDISKLCYERDSTLLIGKEVQKRGYDVVYVRSDWLVIENGKLIIYGQGINLLDSFPYFTLNSDNIAPINFSEIYVVLLRQNPPCDSGFINNLQFLLNLYNSKEICMVNDPNAIINFNEKLIPSMIGSNDIYPPFIVTSNSDLAYNFLVKNKKVVLKPMNACSGMGIMVVSLDDKNFLSAWSLLKNKYKYPIIVQKFIPNDGDKRVIISNGEIVSAMKRVPNDFDFRSNLCLGALEEETTLTDKEVFISENVASFMKNNNILWSGLDFIDENLIEVNITSPTGLMSLNRLYKSNFEGIIWNDIELYVNDFYKV